MTLREAILISVNAQPGIKSVELVLRVMELIASHGGTFNAIEYFTLTEIMIASGELVELEYVLASMPYKIKSLYFPKGTSLDKAQQETSTDGTVRHGQPAGSLAE